MRYNPIPDTDEDLTDYRGSIVHLSPATTYEVQLTLAGTSTITNLTATTWSEDFPVDETVRVDDSDTPLAITESGAPGAYRVYDGRGATIDVRHRYDNCITIDASFRSITVVSSRRQPNGQWMKNSACAAPSFVYPGTRRPASTIRCLRLS